MSATNKELKRVEYRYEKGKWFLVFLMVVAGVWGNAYFDQMLLLYRVLALVALGIGAAFVARYTQKGALCWETLKEAKVEIRRVVWPTRQETVQTTLVVIIVVLIMGFVLWCIDSLLGWLVQNFVS